MGFLVILGLLILSRGELVYMVYLVVVVWIEGLEIICYIWHVVKFGYLV